MFPQLRSKPISLIWEAELVPNYVNHIAFVRQGEIYGWNSPWGPYASPLISTMDIAKATVRMPYIWVESANSDLKMIDGFKTVNVENVDRIYGMLLKRAQNDPVHEMKLSIGQNQLSGWGAFLDSTWRSGAYLATLPLKIALDPILLDGLGTPSWYNMKKNEKALFNRPEEFDLTLRDGKEWANREICGAQTESTQLPDRPECSTGAVAIFQRKFELFLLDHPELEVTLVGHSMGTILFNEYLRNSFEGVKNYKRIVYMGAADSIRGFSESVVPYLESNKDAQFYNLSLHPSAEVGEMFTMDIAQRGSLLVWIDNFFENPDDFEDRTLGQWLNIIQAAHVIPEDVKAQVNLKAFDFHNPDQPQKHGEFMEKGFPPDRHYDENRFLQYITPAPASSADTARGKTNKQ